MEASEIFLVAKPLELHDGFTTTTSLFAPLPFKLAVNSYGMWVKNPISDSELFFGGDESIFYFYSSKKCNLQ